MSWVKNQSAKAICACHSEAREKTTGERATGLRKLGQFRRVKKGNLINIIRKLNQLSCGNGGSIKKVAIPVLYLQRRKTRGVTYTIKKVEKEMVLCRELKPSRLTRGGNLEGKEGPAHFPGGSQTQEETPF